MEPIVSVKNGRTSLTGEYVMRMDIAVSIDASTNSFVFLVIRLSPYRLIKLFIIISALAVKPDER